MERYLPSDFAGVALGAGRGAVMVLYVDTHESVVSPGLGPEAAADLLARVDLHLRALLAGTGATIRRLHASHFVVVLPSIEPPETAALALAITRIGWKDDPETGPVLSSLSVGVAPAPADGLAAVADLMRDATLASEEAYLRFPGTYVMFTPDVAKRYETQVSLSVDLRKAIDEGHISLVFQPQVRLSDGAFVGAEVLARWTHPTLGDIPPDRFVALAERAGLVRWLDSAVFEKALAQLREWDDEGVVVPRLAVNVSPITLTAPLMRSVAYQGVARHRIDPRRIAFEVIESQLVESAVASQVLIELSEFGFRISLDDFGSGYSSFGQLAALPIHELKVDRAFVWDQRKGLPVLTAATHVADAFGQELVAEGIETSEQVEMLTRLGCQFGQGYYFSKPLPAVEFADWVRSR